MATGPRPSFQKRQKELARLAKQEEKRAKRLARKKGQIPQEGATPPEGVGDTGQSVPDEGGRT